jgi:LemA protein
MVYNTYKQSFPAVMLAGTFGHAVDAALLEFDSEAIAEAPKVSF